jgi:hypothetical protein
MAPKVLWRSEIGRDMRLTDTLLQRFQLFCGGAGVDILHLDRMIVVTEENEPWLFQFDRVIVFHLSDRNFMAIWNSAVAIGENSNIDIRPFDHLQRGFDCVRIERRRMFHHVVRREMCLLAREPRLIAMLRQIERRAGNHHRAPRHSPLQTNRSSAYGSIAANIANVARMSAAICGAAAPAYRCAHAGYALTNL